MYIRNGLMLVVLGAAALAACGGCMHSMTLPAAFVGVDADYKADYLVRGVSADGVVISLRREANPQNGSLEFWAEAVQNRLETALDYKCEGTGAIKSDTGLDGRLLTFTDTQKGVEYAYYVAVYVQGSDILVAEAGGKKAAFEPRKSQILQALHTVR
jgi:hypothetical protein